MLHGCLVILFLVASISSGIGDYRPITNNIDDTELLIICPDRFINHISPLVEWKHKKGIVTTLVPLSTIGEKPEEIKEFIRHFYYYTSETRLKYLLLIGDIEELPPYPHPTLGNTDASYGDVNGDTLIEIGVGRLPARNTGQLLTMITRIFNYERRPKIIDIDTMFYKKATTIRQDPGPYHNAGCYFVRDMILANSDFVSVDTFVNPMHTKNDVRDSLKAGRSYVLYTGHGAGTNWVYPFDLSPYFNNAYRTPVIFSWCCRTVLGKNYLGQRWLRPGNLKRPRGAVAFIGTTTAGLYARYRNFVARNFFRAIFQYQTLDISAALKQGLDSLWQYSPDSFGHVLYQEWNLIGDPTLQLWSRVPQKMICEHDTIINNQRQVFELRVKNLYGEPIPGALVCLSTIDDRTFYYRGHTNHLGVITFEINPQGLEAFDITVSASNYLPYENRCRIIERFIINETSNEFLKRYNIPNETEFFLIDVQGRVIVNSDAYSSNYKLRPGIYYRYEKVPKAKTAKKLILLK
ncbi:MAG: C25 family cysteine peptidase [candidate division WOR-3 bacterium]